MNEQTIRKNNMKIFPIYKMFAWDLLFHYAIIFLFFTQVKGFSASQVFIGDSFYAFFRVVFQIFCINITDLIGKQKSLLLGNLLVTISLVLYILANNLSILIIANFIQAVGYNFKGLSEPTILSDSIPKSSFSSSIYSKINGKGNSLYYIFDSISSAVTGFLYVLNPYIPMILCLICSLIATIISLNFENPPVEKVNTQKSNVFFGYYKDLFTVFKNIGKSNRLKSLLIFSFFFGAILSTFPTLRSDILVYIDVPEQYFGLILAVMQIVSSLTAKKQYLFHNKLKNRTLSWFSLSTVIAFIITGLLVTCNISFTVSLVSTLITILLVGFVKGPYYTLIERYLNSFSNHTVNTKIFAIKSLLENLGRVLLSFFASFLLNFTTISYSFVIIGCIFFIIFIFLLNYMKTKVGLKPEEYPKEDLIFSSEK